MKTEANAVNVCGAHARTTGKPCQRAPVPGKKRCRLHGGTNPGRPKTSGLWTYEARAARKQRGEIRRLLAGLKRGLA
jgi:hypothetical protein